MEAASLTKVRLQVVMRVSRLTTGSQAHDHARAASIATQTSDTTVAVNEHTRAAGEFSNAAKSTSSVEALRTLKLLEAHHRRLSELLQFPQEEASQPSALANENSPESEKQGVSGEKENHDAQTRSQSPDGNLDRSIAKPVPTLSHQRKLPGRNLSSSIASNLASARGIRSKHQGLPLTPSVSKEQAPGSLEVHPRRDPAKAVDLNQKPSWVPPSPNTISQDVRRHIDASGQETSNRQEASRPATNDDGVSRFYSTFGSIINRLSAPLAFAGLPLITEEQGTGPEQSENDAQQNRIGLLNTSWSASVDPDLTKIYSKATLRALGKDGRGPADSFYVVPTTGHTASYANILTYDQKERRRLAASVHDDDGENPDEVDDEDFVDAREAQGLKSVNTRRKPGKPKCERERRNIVEELYIENASLKEMLDKLSKRLQTFECNSQNSGLALAQSLRLQRPGSPLHSSIGSGTGSSADEVLRKRNRELEEQMALMAKEMAKLEREYVRSQVTVEKYRERWEKLKAGAKARRDREEQTRLDSMEPAQSSR